MRFQFFGNFFLVLFGVKGFQGWFFFVPNKFLRDFFLKLKTISIFWLTFFVQSFLISFFVARYLTVSLRGPVLEHYGEAEGRVWWGGMGWGGVGWDGVGSDGLGGQKCPLFILILRYIKQYTDIYLNTYKKCPKKFLGD